MPVQIIQKENYTILQVGLNFNVKNLADIRKAVEKVLSIKPAIIVFDMAECELLDSSGIGLLVNLQKRCAPYGGKVGLLDPPDDIRDIVFIAGIEKLISIYNSEEDIL